MSSAATEPAPSALRPSPAPSSATQATLADDPLRRSAERAQRLSNLVETRRLYRNCVRAQHLLGSPSPVYRPPQLDGEPPAEGADAGGDAGGLASPSASIDAQEDKALKQALDTVAEMALVAEQLKVGAWGKARRESPWAGQRK
jgi:hypothetical protein